MPGSLWEFSESSGMRVMPMEELHDRGWRWAVEEARRVVGAGPCYLSFDIDSLDPAWAPGTGTPEAGGLTMIEAQRIVRGLMGLDVVGADLVEVSPPFDVGGITAFHGASMLFEILCVAAAARIARASGSGGHSPTASPATARHERVSAAARAIDGDTLVEEAASACLLFDLS